MAQTPREQMRAWHDLALFSFGFRPFFLFGALWVVIAMVLWIMALNGAINIPTRFDPVSWHAHEFLFGYLSAVLAGFLLTAVPNWTGRLPIVGAGLVGLFAIWCMGRLAIMISALLPTWLAMAVDVVFPIALGVVILREIIAGKNWRNLIVIALLAVFTLANILFHVEAIGGDIAAQGHGLRLGVATAVMMIGVIGGRIIPSFTRNWLAKRDNPARPTPPMQKFDKVTLVISIAILGIWVVLPNHAATGPLLVVFGALHTLRLLRWQGHRTWSEPLVWVLHAAYAFVPLGAFAMAFASLQPNTDPAAGQHIWMAGAIGAMTLAVMTRSTLGHTGRTLTAGKGTTLIYLGIFASVAARWLSGDFAHLITVSAMLWICAFAGFALIYGPALVLAKNDKTP